MNKTELISEISKSTEIDEDIVRKVFNSMVRIIQETLFFGLNVEIKNFISFKLKRREGRVVKNPKTGKEVNMPTHYRVAVALPFVFRQKMKTKKIH
jgi:nucleoid DNA-binding protein